MKLAGSLGWIITLWILPGVVAAIPLTVTLDPIVASPSPGAPAGHVVAAWAEPESGEERRIVAVVEGPRTVAFEVPKGVMVRVSAAIEGFWGRDRVVHTANTGTSIQVDLWPTGWLAGSLQMPSGHEPPQEITIRAQTAPGEEPRLEAANFVCPVEKGRWRCRVPAGNLDLRLRRKGYVSHYFWGIGLGAGKERHLGLQELVEGASVVGWVSVSNPSKRLSPLKTRIQLAPQVMGLGPSLEDLTRRDSLGWTATASQRGFFQFSGIPPGSYVLEASHPGFAEARLAPVTVLEGAETEVRQVALGEPVTFELVLRQAMSPFREAWRVMLLKEGPVPGHLDLVREGLASERGTWRAEGLEPGGFRVEVLDGRGSRWAHQPVRLVEGTEKLEILLPVMRLEGTLTLGGEPLAAQLWFGGEHNARRIGIRSDEEGMFYVFLPRQDAWEIDVIDRRAGIDRRLVDVAIPEKRADQPWPRIEIDLPDFRIEGQVVDRDGRHFGGAHIRAIGGNRREIVSIGSSPSDGTFTIQALEEGTWRLEGTATRAGTTYSGDITAKGWEENSGSPISLILKPENELTGQIVSPAGQGVPGAQVVAILEQPDRQFWSPNPTVNTDVSGTFRISLPAEAAAVQLTVFPPGFATSQLRVDLSNADPVVIPVDTVGGTLILRYPPAAEMTQETGKSSTTVFQDYLVGHSHALFLWAQAHGIDQDEDTLTIPMLAPGHYTVCRGLGEAPYRGFGPPDGAQSPCASGFLGPHSELRLRLP